MIPSSTADRLWATSILDAIVRDPFAAPLPSTRQQEVAVVQMLLRDGTNATQTSERSTLYVNRLSKEARLAFTSILMGMAGDRPSHQTHLAFQGPVWNIHQTNLGVLAPGEDEEIVRATSSAVIAFGFTVSETHQKPEAGTPEDPTLEHPGVGTPISWKQDLKGGDATAAVALAVEYPHLLPYIYAAAHGYMEGAERFEAAYLKASGVSKAVFAKNVKVRPGSLPLRNAFIAKLASKKEQPAKAIR